MPYNEAGAAPGAGQSFDWGFAKDIAGNKWINPLGLNPFNPGDPMGAFDSRLDNNPYKDIDPNGKLGAIAQRSGDWGDQNRSGYRQNLQDFTGATDHLGRLMRGEHSVAGEQLRQGMQQNVGGQMAMAAGARGGNQAMAARTAANNAASVGAGLSGQQAVAGMQERNQAAATLGGLLNQRGAQQANSVAQGYGQQMQGQMGLEGFRNDRFKAAMGEPGKGEKQMSFITGMLPWYGGGK